MTQLPSLIVSKTLKSHGLDGLTRLTPRLSASIVGVGGECLGGFRRFRPNHVA